jgi:hypothetical protein
MTGAQRRAAQRLRVIGMSLRPPREAAEVRGPDEARGPGMADGATAGAAATAAGEGEMALVGGAEAGGGVVGLEVPPVLAEADALPRLPVVGPGRRLAEALRRMRAVEVRQPLQFSLTPGPSPAGRGVP